MYLDYAKFMLFLFHKKHGKNNLIRLDYLMPGQKRGVENKSPKKQFYDYGLRFNHGQVSH